MKELKEFDEAIKIWHITGEMIWYGLYIELGSWEPIELKNVKAVAEPSDDIELPF